MNYKQVIAGFCLLMSAGVYAQPKGVKGVPNIMTPEAASLGKYGTYDIGYYSGNANISVPLHQVSDNGIDIPISIYYDGSGFIPNKNASVVGLNWNLTAGGAITRVVNGKMDELYDPSNPNTWHDNIGYILGQQLGLPGSTSEHIRTLGFIGNPALPQNFSLNYDYAPDVFSFNFLGHSGRFFMDNVGTVQVTGDRNYQVDLTNFSSQNNFSNITSAAVTSLPALNSNNISEIILTADDGYRFYFGGALKNIEVSFDASTIVGTPSATTGKINSWMLTKVISPEGNITTFKYRDFLESERKNLEHIFDNPSSSWDNIDCPFFTKNAFRNQTRSISIVGGSLNDDLVQVSAIIQPYLTEISTSLQTITFSYEEKDKINNFYGQSSRTFGGSPVTTVNSVFRSGRHFSQKLAGIVVTDKYKPMNAGEFYISKRIVFSYENHSTTKAGVIVGNRQFLAGVKISGADYSFKYNNIEDLPDPLTPGIDMGGFYNGQDGNAALVPLPDLSSGEYDIDLAASGRLPNATYAKYGMLNKIIYPTGGMTEFTYEGNSYSKVLKRKMASGTTPDLETVSNTDAPGLRIRQIKSTPGTTTDFYYVENYETGGTTSTGLMANPAIHYLRYQCCTPAFVDAYITDNNISAGSSYSEASIGYKQVIAVNGEGFTRYTYSNHQSNPDDYDLGTGSYQVYLDNSTNNFAGQLKRLSYYSSRDMERGKLVKTEVFNASNNKVKMIENVYNQDVNRTNNRTLGVKASYTPTYNCTMVQSYALYYYQNNITQSTETDYPDNGGTPTTKTTTYHYKSNTSMLMDQTTITQSDGSKLKTVLKYPVDFAPAAPYNTMLTRFMVSPVVEQLQYKVQGGTDIFLESTITDYGFDLSSSYLKPVSGRLKRGGSSYMNMVSYNKYDASGNLLTYTKTNDASESFIYDYSNSLPIAKVTNAATDQICYTSFEVEGKGNWTFSGTPLLTDNTVTGSRAYQLTGSNNITKAGLTSGSKYIVSYWTTAASALTITGTTNAYQSQAAYGWKCFVHEITGQTTITITGSSLIDELRLYPDKSLMTTYTYRGVGGIVCTNDANNNVNYYIYDNAARLVLIRDKERNIIKKICYNFDGQAEDCTTPCYEANPTPVWQNTSTPPVCETNYCGNTGYQLQEQIDINPCTEFTNPVRTRTVRIYNPTACAIATGFTITSSNPSNLTGLVVTYTNLTTLQAYSFSIPNGSATLGCVPSGAKYKIYVDHPAPLPPVLKSTVGSFIITGTPATFNNVNLGLPDNRHLIVDLDFL